MKNEVSVMRTKTDEERLPRSGPKYVKEMCVYVPWVHSYVGERLETLNENTSEKTKRRDV